MRERREPFPVAALHDKRIPDTLPWLSESFLFYTEAFAPRPFRQSLYLGAHNDRVGCDSHRITSLQACLGHNHVPISRGIVHELSVDHDRFLLLGIKTGAPILRFYTHGRGGG